MDHQIKKAKALAKNNDGEGAMQLANELLEQYPNEAKVWSLRAYLHRRSQRFAEAIADLTRAIEINSAQQVHFAPSAGLLTMVDLLFNRGADRFALGDDQSAIGDFTKGLELCDQYKSDDYRETLHFWRAEAFLRLGKKQETLADLARVREDFQFWTYERRTKADLLADCRGLPGAES